MTERLKVMVVSEGKQAPAATQAISFGQPFAGAFEYEILFEPHHRDKNHISERLRAASPKILVLSRYNWPQGKFWIRYARQIDIPIIFHIDDDLLSVPESLGAEKFAAYNNPERLKTLRENIEGCDLIYASTQELGRRFAEYDFRVPIVAGDIYCSVHPDEVGALLPPALGPVFGYMGTGGHSADLNMILPSICALMDQFPPLQFEVFGTIKMPEELARYGNRVRHLPPVANYADFSHHLRSLGWWVGLAPLEDNSFNRCKADTKWVEYSLAGMAVVASDLPVYHRACADGTGILARTNDDWDQALRALLQNHAQREQMVMKAQEKLRRLYSHQALREQVLEVFKAAHALKRLKP